MTAAAELAAGESPSLWDAQIAQAVARAGYGVLLTEDPNHGQSIAGVEIVNPFA